MLGLINFYCSGTYEYVAKAKNQVFSRVKLYEYTEPFTFSYTFVFLFVDVYV